MTVVMMAGLQGAGKTTTTAKLAGKVQVERTQSRCWQPVTYTVLLRSNSCRSTEKRQGVEVFAHGRQGKPGDDCESVQSSMQRANGFNLVILDTAGRLHVDEDP